MLVTTNSHRTLARSGRRGLAGFAGFAVAAVAVVGLLSVGAVVGFALFRQPFKTVVVDRSAPPVLTSLRDLAVYKAADGQYEVLIDVEKDVKYLPSAVAGERVLFVGVGSVDAMVDFRNLTDTHIVTNAERTTAVITLPPATLGTAIVDPAMSRVASRKRGVFDRIAGVFNDNPTSEQALYAAATAKIDAAALESGLLLKAEENTRNMLVTLVKALGYTDVEVRFDGMPVSGPVAETPVTPSPTSL